MNRPAPFTINQKSFYDRCFHSWLNVAEGGKRGGKNVLTTLAFCVPLETHPNRIHLIAGVSIATAKLNILDCDGYGMLNYFAGRCREGEYKNRDCLYVMTPTGEKVVLISGGGKDGDQKLIQGNTYGMAYVTEANLCHQNFIKEVFDRTLSSKDRKIFHDLNPKAPGHWYYKDVLEFHEKQQRLDPAYGYNYGHFTIADNMSVSDAELQAKIKTYDKDSVWFKRDILGLRIAAEGLIYRRFADDPKRYEIKEEDVRNLLEINVGVDFGGNKSGHAFAATGITRAYNNLIGLASERHMNVPRIIDPDTLGKLFVAFCQELIRRFGYITNVYCDNAEQTLIAGLRSSARKGGLGWLRIEDAIKIPINDRIYFTNRLIEQGRFFYIPEHCKTLKDALSTALWNPDEPVEDVRLDDGTTDIDTLDGFEYTFERNISRMIRYE